MGCRDDILSFFYPLPHSLLDRPPGFLNGLQPLAPSGTRLGALGTIWNYLERPLASGTREALMEPLETIWPAQSANGPARSAIVYCSLAGRDKSLYYLRPIIPWNARRALAAIETEPFLALSGPHLGASVPPSCLNVRLPAEPLSLLMIPLRIAIIKIVLEVNK